jgi:hypothetical protein
VVYKPTDCAGASSTLIKINKPGFQFKKLNISTYFSMEQDTTNSPAETRVKLNKLYQKHKTKTEAQQIRLTTDPIGEQIDVALNKYIIPHIKKGVAKGFASVTITSHQINLDFVRTHFARFEEICLSHGLTVEQEADPTWPSDVKSLKFSGWADPLPEPPKHQGETLTDRVISLECRCEILEQQLRIMREKYP